MALRARFFGEFRGCSAGRGRGSPAGFLAGQGGEVWAGTGVGRTPWVPGWVPASDPSLRSHSPALSVTVSESVACTPTAQAIVQW